MQINEKLSEWCKRMQKESEDKSDMTAAYNYYQLAEMGLTKAVNYTLPG